ncbi:ABC transporter ATP-binding protein [Uliginosibacterium sediminicola]|uniref:ABC transporter ATP-binding protein n=1 Tax=Uliginosibacterium sediminicola TaxID=2024550 RepID=A0ABU9YUE2_9RHOO
MFILPEVGQAPPPVAAPPALLRLQGMSKRFGSLQALEDVSLEIAAGEIHCLLGENGAGKSTLCNLIFGVYQADSGSMQLAGADYRPSGPADALSMQVAMVHQHFSLVPDLSVVDNLLLGQARGVLRRSECAERVQALSQRFGLQIDPWLRISDLSVGERQRVEIIKCLMREPRLLVLDEPTAVLLPDEIAALLEVCQRVAAEGCGVVLVTHKLAEIQKVAQRATVLRGGRVAARSEQPAADLDALVQAMIQRSGEARTSPAAPSYQREAAGQPRAEPALMIDGVSVKDADGVTRLDNFTLIVEPGEIVAVAGVEGNGQSELAAVISGMRPASQGRLFVKGRELTGRSPRQITAAGVGVVPEDRHAVGCVSGMSVAENLFLDRLHRFSRYGLLDRKRMRAAALELMQRFDVRAASPDVSFAGLSGGNQQKAVLARELTLDGLSFLLAAQPTRGLDVGAVEAVYEHIRAVCAQGVGVLLISSELDELLKVADRVVVLYRGRIVGSCTAEPGERARIGAWMAGQAA